MKKRCQQTLIKNFVDNDVLYGNLVIRTGIYGNDQWYLWVKQKQKDSTIQFAKHNIIKTLNLSPNEVDVNNPKLINQAQKILSTIKLEYYKKCDQLFDSVDMKFMNRQLSIGRISEDKFKNLMMYNGYEVLTPVEDKWGYDFVLKKGRDYHTVQCKSTCKKNKTFILENKNGVRYKNMVSHMAFIHMQSYEVYYVPCEDLPDKRHITICDDHIKYRIGLDLIEE
jgi:hypothetical protein